jgi:ribosomal protein L32E
VNSPTRRFTQRRRRLLSFEYRQENKSQSLIIPDGYDDVYVINLEQLHKWPGLRPGANEPVTNCHSLQLVAKIRTYE